MRSSVKAVLGMTFRISFASYFELLVVAAAAEAVAASPHALIQMLIEWLGFVAINDFSSIASQFYRFFYSLGVSLPVEAFSFSLALMLLKRSRSDGSLLAGLPGILRSARVAFLPMTGVLLVSYVVRFLKSILFQCMPNRDSEFFGAMVILIAGSLALLIIVYYVFLRLCIAPGIVALNRPEARAALYRSIQVTRGNLSSISGATLAIGFALSAPSYLLLDSVLGSSLAARMVSCTIVAPFLWMFLYALYDKLIDLDVKASAREGSGPST
jgi:hypothetical protein